MVLIIAGLQRVMSWLIKQPGSKEKTRLCKTITDRVSAKIIRNTAPTFEEVRPKTTTASARRKYFFCSNSRWKIIFCRDWDKKFDDH